MTMLAWGAKVSADFRQQVGAIAAGLGVDPSWIMACMYFESRLDPAARNPVSGATGLIQFMPSTARGLGTTTDELAAMTAEAQLNFVGAYFAPFKGRIKTFADCYAAILWPAAVGSPDGEVIFAGGSKAYEQNAALDVGRKGYVTKADAASFPLARLAEGLQPGNVFDDGQNIPSPTTPPRPTIERTQPMGAALALLPLLAQFIPQILTMIKPGSASTARDAALAQTILNTAAQAAGVIAPTAAGAAPIDATAADVGATLDAMHASPQMVQKVQDAVLTHPEVKQVLQIVEIGAGLEGARKADAATQVAEKPFWKVSAVFWISIILLPMVYLYVWSSIAGGTDIPDAWPWYAQLPLKLLGNAWDPGARVGLANLIVGLVLGGIVGVYYGVSVTQGKVQQAANAEKSSST
jgi:hypothetical protein